jgi:hypothetical protein
VLPYLQQRRDQTAVKKLKNQIFERLIKESKKDLKFEKS